MSEREEVGMSLVELLVAIVITGIVASGMLLAWTTLSASSDRARKSADALSVLYTAADALQTLPYDTACPATYSLGAVPGFAASVQSRVRTTDITVTNIQYWNGATATYGPTCTSSLVAGDPRRLQRVSLRAVLPDGRVDRSIEVVKRG
jgi:type II secretory pathway pseudopilin PulG